MISLLAAAALFLTPVTHAKSAIERCEVKSCTCKVKETPGLAQYNKYSTLIVEYGEDKYSLSETAEARILSFVRSSYGPLFISGYSDQCGLHDHNKELSRLRAQYVSDVISSVSRRVFSVKYYGEVHSKNHQQQDRRVVISTYPDNLARMMDAYPADAYLIDASASIRQHWDQIKRYDFPPGSDIYISKMINCENGDTLNNIKPEGGTEIWYSYYYVLGRMNPGETLVLMSDFNSNVPLSASDFYVIEKRAKSRGIKVIPIQY